MSMRDEKEFFLLCEEENELQRSILLTLLHENGIPAFARDNGAGGYIRILTGGSVFGSKIFVPHSCREQAEDLLASISSAGVSDEELNAAAEQAADPEREDAPEMNGVSRLLPFFLIGFGILAVVGLLLLLK